MTVSLPLVMDWANSWLLCVGSLDRRRNTPGIVSTFKWSWSRLHNAASSLARSYLFLYYLTILWVQYIFWPSIFFCHDEVGENKDFRNANPISPARWSTRDLDGRVVTRASFTRRRALGYADWTRPGPGLRGAEEELQHARCSRRLLTNSTWHLTPLFLHTYSHLSESGDQVHLRP